MRSDCTEVLAETVFEKLGKDPRLDASMVSVSTCDGAITLRGRVGSYSEKCCAETLVRELPGVVSVHNAIEVRLSIGNYRTDAGLAHLTNEMLENHTVFSGHPPRATVREGWVILRGVVGSEFRKLRAEAIVSDLAGIRGIRNEIEVLPQPSVTDAKPELGPVIRLRPSVVEDVFIDVSGMTMPDYEKARFGADHPDRVGLASRTRGIARVDDHVTVQRGKTSGKVE